MSAFRRTVKIAGSSSVASANASRNKPLDRRLAQVHVALIDDGSASRFKFEAAAIGLLTIGLTISKTWPVTRPGAEVKRTVLVLVATFVALPLVIAAQGGSGERPRFDVLSVKPNISGDPGLSLDVTPGGRMAASNIPLIQFIRAAYTLQLHQIEGAPSWVSSERFDITGLADGGFPAPAIWKPGAYAPVQVMMQSVLLDRFKMVARMTEREGDGYALVLRTPGSSGALKPSVAPCTSECMQIGAGTVTARGVPLPQFAELLSQVTGRIVVDATELTGTFDFSVRWTPEGDQAVSDAPSLFTALQEQVGLRLQPRRVQIPVLLIESISRPDAD